MPSAGSKNRKILKNGKGYFWIKKCGRAALEIPGHHHAVVAEVVAEVEMIRGGICGDVEAPHGAAPRGGPDVKKCLLPFHGKLFNDG